MTRILRELSAGLPTDVIARLNRTVDVAVRRLDFMVITEDANYVAANKRGWDRNRIEVVVELSAFYQTVIGPLACAGRKEPPCGLGSKITIQCGENTFDSEYGSRIQMLDRDFSTLVSECRIPSHWLSIGDLRDLVWRIANEEERNGV